MATYRLICGDALASLRELPDESVHCVVTSPPYWGLRWYGVDGQIGVETSIDDYVARLVDTFREVRRALRRDGTCWLNLGDSFAGQGGGSEGEHAGLRLWRTGGRTASKRGSGLKPKDLVGAPWRVALALQADGWWLRSDVIWHKPCPMPESVVDRPSRAHEYVFLLARSRRYFYDADSVRTPQASLGVRHEGRAGGRAGAPALMRSRRRMLHQSGANLRDVWSIAPQPSRFEHFAGFPEALVEPCVLAGTSAGGCCAACGAPLARIVEKGEPDRDHQVACGSDAEGSYAGTATKDYTGNGVQDASAVKARILAGMRVRRTTGWQPTCRCDADEPVPCVVLDPFAGTSTTGVVALRHGRAFIGIELNPKYVAMSERRLRDVAPLYVRQAGGHA